MIIYAIPEASGKFSSIPLCKPTENVAEKSKALCVHNKNQIVSASLQRQLYSQLSAPPV